MSAFPRLVREQSFERIPVPLWAVDAEDRTVDVNPALTEALGYPAAELLGRSPAEFVTEDSRGTFDAQSILRRAGVADTYTLTFRTRGGDLRSFRVSGVPILDGDRFAGQIAVLRDLAVWSAVEDAVREANQELLVGLRAQWSGIPDVAHGLRNSLQAILGFQDLLLNDPAGTLSADQKKHLAMLERATREALGLVAKLPRRGTPLGLPAGQDPRP